MHTPSDEAWFAFVLTDHATPPPGPPRDALRAIRAEELVIGSVNRSQD